MLGLPPVWYKSAPYRSRAVIDPKGVLADFGVTLPAETEIRIWDSTAETRFLVLPMRPAGTEGWSEEQLAALVTRDSMVGTGLAKSPGQGGRRDDQLDPRYGRHARLWPGRAGAERAGVPRRLGEARAGDAAGDGRHRAVDDRRRARLAGNPAAARPISRSSYYERWFLGLERRVVAHGLVGEDEIAAGRIAAPRHPAEPQADLGRREGDALWRHFDAAGARRRRASRPATGCAPATSTRRRIPACRAMPAASSARSRRCAAAMSFPTAPRSAPATTRNGSIRSSLPARELWGEAADPAIKVSIEAFEPYLSPA